MDQEALVQYLKENLTIRVETASVYTGGEPLYVKSVTVQLLLENEVISKSDEFEIP
jgi:hypothetical protein